MLNPFHQYLETFGDLSVELSEWIKFTKGVKLRRSERRWERGGY